MLLFCRHAAVHPVLPGGATFQTPQLLHPRHRDAPSQQPFHGRPVPRPGVRLKLQHQVGTGGSLGVGVGIEGVTAGWSRYRGVRGVGVGTGGSLGVGVGTGGHCGLE